MVKVRFSSRKSRQSRLKKVSKPTVSLVKAVAKKVVEDALEDKYCTTSMTLTGYPVYFNAGISSNAEIYPLLPQIGQGVNSSDRVGDRVRPKQLRVDFVITANGSYTSSQLNQIRLFILQDKSIRNTAALKDIPALQTGTPIQTILDTGGNTAYFTGIPSDIMRRVNKQRYTVFKDKVLEVCAGKGQTPQPGNGYSGDQTFVSGQQCWKLSFIIPTPKVLMYSALGDAWPSNFAPFMCLGYVQPDGNASPDNLLTRVAVNWVSHLDFEDA